MPNRYSSPIPDDYTSFWRLYLQAHNRAHTRALHYTGTSLALGLLLAAALRRDWRLALAAPVTGYGCAWAGHALLEGNQPATFGHPLWSLLSDFRMFGLAITGRLQPHLNQARSHK
ncbi:MAG: DUF962 domain-containing protein [Acetobacteraceae bacterium]|nr:DUF962 domain-containing protein [Acetobacteraceae bacterium]